MNKAMKCDQNPILRFLKCSRFRKKSKLEKLIEKGEKRLDKQLDVRSLIMTQNLLMSMIKLFVKSKSNRKLMRIQWRHKVLETSKKSIGFKAAVKDSSFNDEKEDLTVSAGSEIKILKRLISHMQSVDYNFDTSSHMDQQSK